VPIGAHAHLQDGEIHMHAIVASPDGSRVIRGTHRGRDPEQVGAELGRRLLDEGAREILDRVYAA
jgi:hydroxymethylbilane synthase